MENRVKKWFYRLLEFLKWAVIIWLLWPLSQSLEKPPSFPRIMLGILLFVIFAGKQFYDSVLTSSHENKTRDLLSLLGTVIVLAIIVLAAVAFLGLLIYRTISRDVETF